MKILIYTHCFPPVINGVATYAENLAKQLAKFGHKVLVVCPKVKGYSKDNDAKLEFNIVRPFVSRNITKLNLLLGGWSFLRALVTFHPDKVLIIDGQAQIAASVVGRIIPFRYFVTIHGDQEIPEKKDFKSGILLAFLKKARAIITVCDAYKKKLESCGITRGKIFSVPCAVDERFINSDRSDPQKLRSKLGLDDNFVLLSVARLTDRKGQDNTILALSSLISRYPFLRYVIVGKGEYEMKLKDMVCEMCLEEHIIFLGAINNIDLIPIYDMSDVFIMPSRDVEPRMEGLPISILEAGARGKPVIAGNSGGVAEFISDDVGILVNGENVSEIEAQIVRLIENRFLCVDLGKNLKEKISKGYTWEVVGDKIFRVLAEHSIV